MSVAIRRRQALSRAFGDAVTAVMTWRMRWLGLPAVHPRCTQVVSVERIVAGLEHIMPAHAQCSG